MSRTVITNVRVLCPASGQDQICDVLLADGQIEALGNLLHNPSATEVIDGSGHWLLPTAIDLCARLREPGASHKATIASEAHAAQQAGIGVLVMPPDTQPVADSPAVIDRIHAKAQAAQRAQVRVLGALTQGLAGDALGELASLQAAGCLGISNALKPLSNLLVARRALEYAHGLGLVVHVIANEPSLANHGCAHEGPIATRLGLPGIPVSAEISSIRQWLSLVEDTGATVHFGRLSSARGAELLTHAQARGLPVTADVAAHQLFLTDADLEGFNAMAHVIPPLRSEYDRQGLLAAVASGVIGSICSDHQPHEVDAKVNPLPMTEPGISALETLIPLTLALVHAGTLTPLQAAQRLHSGPAQVLGLAASVIAVGQKTPLILINPAKKWTLCAQNMHSAGKNSPFLGREFTGKVVRVWG